MKNIRTQFEQTFSPENLRRIYDEKIIYSGGTGIDNITHNLFKGDIDAQLEILSRKILSGEYKFTKYKLNLLSKGRGKPPREISIPTIRDRIALRAICDFLQERFYNSLNIELPQSVIKQIKSDISNYNYTGFIKLDVSDFYPSINHALLRNQLNKRLRKHPAIVNMIFSALRAPTVIESKKNDAPNENGVPQGLSISNILACIYMQDLDKFLKNIPKTTSFRYVDDILILCDYTSARKISDFVISKFDSYSLKIHCPIKMPHKSKIGALSLGFDYLGYDFNEKLVSVKESSIEKLKASLVGIFTSYKYSKTKSTAFLTWRINLRITGCIFENKSKGWLFFFSEINDEALLHRLDYFVNKLCKRFETDITPKKFVRAFKEICHNRYNGKYIPNFDNYTIEQKGNVLANYFQYDVSNMSPTQIDYEFHRKVQKQIRDLESDIKDFSISG
ncbi:MAG: reverse transcriptase domain-containing protein [Plesiomonas shigelloides]